MALPPDLRARLLRPRRIAAAVAVFLTLGGGLGGLLGAVAAADGPEPARDGLPFTLALPRSGDRGTYHVVAAEGQSPADGRAAPSLHPLDVAWLDDRVVHGQDGRSQWANMVRVVEGEAEDGDDALFALEPGGAGAFAAVRAADGGVPGAAGAGVSSGSGDVSSSHLFAVQEFVAGQAAALPCGLRSPLAGRAVRSLEEALPVAAPCRQAPAWDGEGRTLRLLFAAAAPDGTRLLEAEEADAAGDAAVRYLFREDVPYPLRIQPSGARHALELQSFARGAGPVRTSPQGVRTEPAPPLQFAPRDAAGGPSEAGISHPYPLSAAVRGAREAEGFPDLRDFLRGHPDAYVAAATYRDLVSNGRDGTWHSWRFTITDGQESLAIGARMIVQEAVAAPDPLGALPDQTAYDYSAGEVEGAVGVHPPPASAPDGMPTVASQWAAWRAFASPEYAAETPNLWGFSIRCLDACDAVAIRHEAGYTHYNRTEAAKDSLPVAVMPGDPIDSEVQSLLAWRLAGDGRLPAGPAEYREHRIDWRRDGQGAPPTLDLPAPRAARSTVLASLWQMPGAGPAAAAGLGALLAALAYWLWPAVKAGPAALFSRVRGEDLLDNPLRAQIHQRIEAEPGIHHQAIVRAVGRGQGAVEHHLRKLVDGGLVTRVQGTGYTCYFPKGRVGYRAMAAAPLLKSPVARSILDEVRRAPGIRSADLARALSVAPATIHYHVERLRAAGLVEGSLARGAMRLRPAADAA